MTSPPPEQAAGSFLPSPTHRPPPLGAKEEKRASRSPLGPPESGLTKSSSSRIWWNLSSEIRGQQGALALFLTSNKPLFTECLHPVRGGLGLS